MNSQYEWLLGSDPWVAYRTRLDLLGQADDTPDVITARKAMMEHQLVLDLIRELSDWPSNPTTGVSKAIHPLNKLVFLADIGLTVHDPGIEVITDKVMAHQSPEGAFQIITNGYASRDEDRWGWKSCDFPSLLYALVKMGLGDDKRVKKAVDCLIRFSYMHGWPCVMSRDMAYYTEPGPQDDPCPIVNIIALKTLALLSEHRTGKAARDGVNALLSLWEYRDRRRPNMFGIGKRFVLLKAPFVWYDILHLLEVLTQFPETLEDKRLRQMLDTVKSKADGQNRFTIESISPGWETWDFGQDKKPSPWLTFLVYRIFKRAGMPLA
jgi:hypothetical protein